MTPPCPPSARLKAQSSQNGLPLFTCQMVPAGVPHPLSGARAPSPKPCWFNNYPNSNAYPNPIPYPNPNAYPNPNPYPKPSPNPNTSPNPNPNTYPTTYPNPSPNPYPKPYPNPHPNPNPNPKLPLTASASNRFPKH